MSLTLILQQCPTCLVHLTWMVFEMGSKCPYCCYFLGCCFQDFIIVVCSILVLFPSYFSPCVLLGSMWYIHPYCSINTATIGKTFCFIVLEKANLQMINNLLLTVNDFARGMVTSLSVDEILLLRYMNLSTNFLGQPLRAEMASCFKHMSSILFAFTWLLLLALGYDVGIQ